MLREFESGRFEAGARFQSTEALGTPEFRQAERALENGCVGCVDNDHSRRHECGHCVVG